MSPAFRGGIARRREMGGENVDVFPAHAKGRLGYRPLIADEALRLVEDRPFAENHDPFAASRVLGSLRVVPADSRLLL